MVRGIVVVVETGGGSVGGCGAISAAADPSRAVSRNSLDTTGKDVTGELAVNVLSKGQEAVNPNVEDFRVS